VSLGNNPGSTALNQKECEVSKATKQYRKTVKTIVKKSLKKRLHELKLSAKADGELMLHESKDKTAIGILMRTAYEIDPEKYEVLLRQNELHFQPLEVINDSAEGQSNETVRDGVSTEHGGKRTEEAGD
jgi:PHD/YefM family antitoxin component YafN of YafNO toxin-antitoxin module